MASINVRNRLGVHFEVSGVWVHEGNDEAAVSSRVTGGHFSIVVNAANATAAIEHAAQELNKDIIVEKVVIV